MEPGSLRLQSLKVMATLNISSGSFQDNSLLTTFKCINTHVGPRAFPTWERNRRIAEEDQYYSEKQMARPGHSTWALYELICAACSLCMDPIDIYLKKKTIQNLNVKYQFEICVETDKEPLIANFQLLRSNRYIDGRFIVTFTRHLSSGESNWVLRQPGVSVFGRACHIHYGLFVWRWKPLAINHFGYLPLEVNDKAILKLLRQTWSP